MRRYLYEYSTEELVAELASRREGPREREVSRWCDQCVNFRFNTLDKLPREVDNCTKGHTMAFRMPADHPSESDEWGFYRRGCRDWCRRPPPPRPAPLPEPPPPPRPPMGTRPRRVR